ncbi:TonB-dependent receptor [Luteirhabdus pelagi]|uniref:TonB-dependent receptor n=1 Tax=Luteirhabdus pelagi TaxID=2792783 RepID=UPI00193A73B7|nr:TonB-dependent receptor [Luteirhabdus pelagi]
MTHRNLFSLLLLLLLAASTNSLMAQSIKLRGTIQDSIGQPLELANVVAMVQGSSTMEGYSITNYEGRYQMDLSKGNNYSVRASFLGYEAQEKIVEVPADAEDITLNFNLNSLADELEGVEIVYEMPVTVKGDTIVYNADSFNRGDERKLGDVMKNLPGVEVNEDGEIQVEGKAVQKVMVEGKDFFDGDSKLATKNIPADAVDKVEVLRNYNEVNQMRGLGNDQDNVAINIRLKEGKKKFWFGEVTAGGGISDRDEQGRYLAHPKLFYYSPDYSINLLTDFNNIGEVPFTFRDYFNFTGGFRNFNRGGGTQFNISEGDLGFAIARNNRAQNIEAGFLAGNFSWKASEKWDLSGFAILSDNKTDMVTNSIREFIGSGTTETTNSTNDQRSQLGMFKLSSVYKPSVDFQLDYDVLLKASKQTEDANTLSLFEDITNDISERKENTPASINQNVNAYYTLNEKNIFAGQLQHLYQDEDPFYRVLQDVFAFQNIIPVDNEQQRYNINQQKNVKTHKIDGKVDHYYVLNNTSNLNFTLGGTYSHQQFDSRIFQLLDNGGDQQFTETSEVNGETFPLQNDVNFGFTDLFAGIHYKVKTGAFIFTPGVTLHNYNVKNDQLGLTTSQNEWNLLPDLNIIWELKKSENIRFNYAMSAQYTDVNDYAEAYVLNNYNRLYRGNRFLEKSLAHTYNLTYFSFNMFNYTNISASLNYSRRVEAIKNQLDIFAINQASTPFNIDSNFPDETFSAVGRFSKRVKKLQFRANANLSYSQSFNTINQQIAESTSFTQNYEGSIRSSFKEWPNFEVGYNFTLNDYENANQGRTFYTHRPFANIDVNFLKDFTLSADWEYYNYSDESNTVENTYSFLNATLYYQKGESPWEFELRGDNLLDTEFLNNDSFNEQFNTTSQYFVMPRIFMLVVRYEL